MTPCPLCGVMLASKASMGGHFTNAHPKAARPTGEPCEYARRGCTCTHCREFNRVRGRARRAVESPTAINRIVTPRPGWFNQAACRGHDTNQWFTPGSNDRGSAAKAIAICRRCPVRTDCLEHALEHDEWLGIWGGTQPSERHRIAARRTGAAR